MEHLRRYYIITLKNSPAIHQESEATLPSLAIKITAKMLKTLPLVLRQQLHDAALSLDLEETAFVIAKIFTLAPDVANGLSELAKNYQFDQIIRLTESTN